MGVATVQLLFSEMNRVTFSYCLPVVIQQPSDIYFDMNMTENFFLSVR